VIAENRLLPTVKDCQELGAVNRVSLRYDDIQKYCFIKTELCAYLQKFHTKEDLEKDVFDGLNEEGWYTLEIRGNNEELKFDALKKDNNCKQKLVQIIVKPKFKQ